MRRSLAKTLTSLSQALKHPFECIRFYPFNSFDPSNFFNPPNSPNPLSSNIIQIIAIYLNITNLISFLLAHKINSAIKFAYYSSASNPITTFDNTYNQLHTLYPFITIPSTINIYFVHCVPKIKNKNIILTYTSDKEISLAHKFNVKCIDISSMLRVYLTNILSRINITNLEDIDLSYSNNTNVSHVMPILKKIPNLTKINLQCTTILDFSILKSFPNLKHINVGFCNISNIDFLTYKNITYINLSASYLSSTDLNILNTCTKLTHIILTHCIKIQHINFLSTCTTGISSDLGDSPL